jgi:hypothetical protein
VCVRRKVGVPSPRKIDLAVAAVMALERAAWHAGNGIEGSFW